jgi:hypothetical protein
LERILSNLRLICQRNVPTVSELLDVASGMMPERFCKSLSKAIMDIGREWASGAQFPGLKVIVPAQSENTETGMWFLLKTEWEDKSKRVIIKDKEQVNLNETNPEQSVENKINHLWKWNDEPETKQVKVNSNPWIWPPCEALLYGTATSAAKAAMIRIKESDSAIFEGSLCDGPDLKATIRSVIRGESRMHVKTTLIRKRKNIPDGKRPDPSVFIFAKDHFSESLNWSLLFAGFNVGDHVTDKARFEEG